MWELLRGVSRYLFWLALALPGVVLWIRYQNGGAFYGEVVHLSGQWATQLLIAALAVSPLRALWPRHAWTRWLLGSRRYLGVASFSYAVLHTGVYLDRKGELGRILSEAMEPGLLTGWLALAIFLPLAITSNDLSVRVMRRAWKALHRCVYLATALVLAHWVLTSFDRTLGLVHVVLVLALEGVRVVAQYLRRRRAAAA